MFNITEGHFPTPQLRLTSNDDQDVVERERLFAQAQAALVQEALAWLTPYQRARRNAREARLAGVYDLFRIWRHGVAVGQQLSEHVGSARELLDLESEVTNVPLRLGVVGALREGARWDVTQGTFVGGEPTPASRLAEELGRQIRQRFEQEAPDASAFQDQFASLLYTDEELRSAWLARGEAARQALTNYAQAESEAGRALEYVDIGGDPLCVVPEGGQVNSVHLWDDAMELLSNDEYTLSDWANAMCLLAHAWCGRPGHEDIHQMFAVATGAALFGTVPELPSDGMVRALVMPRAAFVDEVLALSR